MNEDTTAQVMQDDEISLKDIVAKIADWRRFLLEKWKIIIFSSVLGGALGLVYSFVKKPVYTALLNFAL